jgi:hypothetical protein
MKNLIIILGETRASEITFKNIKTNLIDQLNADICICIGVKGNYDTNNEFYKIAKYKFLYPEPEDYGNTYDLAYDIIINSKCDRLEKIKNEDNHLPWRKFLEIKDQFMGGIKDKYNEHPGSAGILIFYRWLLLSNLLKNNLINKYDRFIITRSDFTWLLPHPSLELLDKNYIWVPNGEHYRGITDRHVVISGKYIISYLNILECFVLKSKDYFSKLKNHDSWNLEQIIKFHLEQEGIFNKVKFFPYVMFTVRPIGGTTRWSFGKFCKKLNCYIKYQSEYQISNYNKKKYNFYKFFYFSLNTFYKFEINSIYIYNYIKNCFNYLFRKY